MNKVYFIIIMLLIQIVACANNDRQMITGEKGMHPILNMELVEMPMPGNVEWLTGEALLKKKNSNQYIPACLGLEINAGDIFWLKKGATIQIAFEDGTYVTNKPVSKDRFFTFEIVSSNK